MGTRREYVPPKTRTRRRNLSRNGHFGVPGPSCIYIVAVLRRFRLIEFSLITLAFTPSRDISAVITYVFPNVPDNSRTFSVTVLTDFVRKPTIFSKTFLKVFVCARARARVLPDTTMYETYTLCQNMQLRQIDWRYNNTNRRTSVPVARFPYV